MKKTILVLTITGIFATNGLISCKSNSEKETDAKENVMDAENKLDAVQDDSVMDAKVMAVDADWQSYKNLNQAIISENKERIKSLKIAKNKNGTTFDSSYASAITELESKNTMLQKRIENYENNKTDWESFKREFDYDMTGLVDALEDLGKNNKK